MQALDDLWKYWTFDEKETFLVLSAHCGPASPSCYSFFLKPPFLVDL